MDDFRRYWPIAGLVVRTPMLELRWPNDEELAVLASVAAEGIHDPSEMPFGAPWSRAPVGELERNLIQFHWLKRAEWAHDGWSWNPVVVVDGEIVGTQGVGADQFGLRRSVSTGSWLGQPFHGRGIGTEMRAAVLHFSFAGLYADRAETSAAENNPASLGVTRKLGYKPNGSRVHAVEGTTRLELCFLLERHDWEERRRDDIEIEGLEPCLPLFGAQRAGTTPPVDA